MASVTRFPNADRRPDDSSEKRNRSNSDATPSKASNAPDVGSEMVKEDSAQKNETPRDCVNHEGTTRTSAQGSTVVKVTSTLAAEGSTHISVSDSIVSQLNNPVSDDGSTRISASDSTVLQITNPVSDDGSTQTSAPDSIVPKVTYSISSEGSTQTKALDLNVDAGGSTVKYSQVNCENPSLLPDDIRVDDQGDGSDSTRNLTRLNYINALNLVDSLGQKSWIEVPLGGGTDELGASKDSMGDAPTILSKTEPVKGSDSEDDDFGMLKPGSKFGQFTIIRYVGGGGMGRVYEGEDNDLERKVAIKILAKKRAQDEAVVARFLNEAKSAARLNHENIAQVYLSGNVNGVPYIAFEFVDGVNLRDYVRDDGVLELGEAIDYVLQTAAALAHAASHGVTHRDVKPSNIIVTPQKRVKLIDMGLARLLKPQLNDDLTESGVTLGTFDYISPEQARDPRVADVRSDVYSLGCTFYYMLVGAPPFPEGTMLQKLLQHQGDEAPDVREKNKNVPVEIAAVIKKMMKKNPDERYQTPEALISDLLEISDMLGLRVAGRGHAEPPQEPEKKPNVRAWKLPGICAVLLFGLVVGAYSLFTVSDDIELPTVETHGISIADIPDVAEPNADAVKGRDANPGPGDLVETPKNFTLEDVVAENGSVLTPVAKPDPGVEVSPAALDAMYAAANGGAYTNPSSLGTDDALDWRRSFISAEFSVAAEKRVAFGWRSNSLEPANVSFSMTKYSESSDVALPLSRSFVVYSNLGSKVENGSNGTGVASSVRVVDRVGKVSAAFVSLQDALADASSAESKDAIRIELRFNDALPVPALSIADRKVEIYAADGFSPTLRFEPVETFNASGGSCMFLLNGSELTLRGVAIDFTVPSQDVLSLEEWSVFDGVGASAIVLRDSIVTVCNMVGDVYSTPLHSNVAIFRANADQTFADSGSAATSSVALTARLENVLARGEATVFAAEKRGVKLESKNSGLNVSGPVMYYVENGSKETTNSSSCFSLNLEHTVVIGRSSLVRVDSEDAAVPPPVFDVALTNSIVWLNEHALALLLSPAQLDENAFVSRWKFEKLLAMNVAAFYRRRSSRIDPVQDYPFALEGAACELVKLSDLDSEAEERIVAIPPHRFKLLDFAACMLNPARLSIVVSNANRENAENIRNGFVESLVDRFL